MPFLSRHFVLHIISGCVNNETENGIQHNSINHLHNQVKVSSVEKHLQGCDGSRVLLLFQLS